jgi:hypothetical protein
MNIDEEKKRLGNFYDSLNSQASVLDLRYYHELQGVGGSSDPIRSYSRDPKSFTSRELSEMELLIQDYQDIVHEFIVLESSYANLAETEDEESKEMQSEVRRRIEELTNENLNRDVNLRVLQGKNPLEGIYKEARIILNRFRSSR